MLHLQVLELQQHMIRTGQFLLVSLVHSLDQLQEGGVPQHQHPHKPLHHGLCHLLVCQALLDLLANHLCLGLEVQGEVLGHNL